MRAAAWLLLAAALMGAAMWVLLREEPRTAAVPAGAAPLPAAGVPLPPSLASQAAASAGASGSAGSSAEPQGAVPSQDLADHAHRFSAASAPSAAQVIAELRRQGVREGLAAFNPPGTKPLLVGLAVPPDFVLPAGYVRHHQTTDDGQDVEPVLRFHPDHRLFDAAGRPVPLPPDLLVPPEWAPAGLPLRRIVPPAPAPAPTPR